MLVNQKITRALYQTLLGLYPQEFREQFGEAMAQTFNDLCNEQKNHSPLKQLGFVLWQFGETVGGIIEEHRWLATERHPMKNALIHFRLPALTGFFIILPFIVIQFVTVITQKLAFDLRDWLDSSVMFGVLWLGVVAILLILMPLLQTIRAGSTRKANFGPAQENTLLTNPASTTLISFILALPFLTIFSFLLLNIEPPFAALLNDPNPDQPNVIGTVVVLVALLLAVTAGLIARAPIVRAVQAGESLLAHPLNLILAVIILGFLSMFVGGLMIDQYPCWIGVPNCD